MSVVTIKSDEFPADRVNGALNLVPGMMSCNVLLDVDISAILLDQMYEKLERGSDV